MMMEPDNQSLGSAWDLSAAIEALRAPILLNNESCSETTSYSEGSTAATSASAGDLLLDPEPEQHEPDLQVSKLGNFDSVWVFLKAETDPVYSSVFSVSQDQDGILSRDTIDEDDRALACLPSALSNVTAYGRGLPDHALTKTRKEAKNLSKKSARFHSKKLSDTGYVDSTVLADEEPKINIANDEERRRKIMQDMSDPPSRSLRKGNSKGSAPMHLVPSSIATPSSNAKKSTWPATSQPDLSVSVAKKTKLLNLLDQRFPTDNAWSFGLTNPGNAPNLPEGGIHVFVDISNILIGFHDTLKVHKGLSKSQRLPRQTLSFHNLSLVFERGRPVAKKILVGSDHVDSTQEAEALGYETQILTRVEKPEKGRVAAAFSDSDSARPRPTRKGEQAVDEILQLHILKSIVDYEEPTTIVLASGDAAEGQFSDGFLRAVERGLRKGWKVEIVAWKANISYAYRNPKWTSLWGAAFRIIELDEFVELLHVERGA